MAMRVKIDRAAIRRLSASGGIVDQAVARAAGRVRDDAKRIISSEGRVNTGALVQSIYVKKGRDLGHVTTYYVGSDLKYAIFQHEGVQGPIVPRRARVLRFTSGGKTVFTMRSRGFKGIKYLTRALDNLTPGDYT